MSEVIKKWGRINQVDKSGYLTGDLIPERSKILVLDVLTIINKQSGTGRVRCHTDTDMLQGLPEGRLL